MMFFINKRLALQMSKFKEGDKVFYSHPTYTVEAIVLKLGTKKILLKATFREGEREVFVSPYKVILQAELRQHV